VSAAAPARTRVVATLGPASRAESTIAALAEAGVAVFRLNFSHGTHAEHGETIARIRRATAGRDIAILQDLGGPKLRLDRPVAGKAGEVVELGLPATVRPGDPVLLADGAMQLEVVDAAHARVLVGGEIPAGKGINLPSSHLDIPSLTPKDEADLRFGVAAGVDLVAVSFVRRAEDLAAVRAAGLPVVAKIETAQAVTRMAELVDAADAIMVARGDLGVEIPIERVPVVQKELIALANRAAKPVITATQMLRSMVESLLPTRAEATDVANAVLDGSDAVMLSEETAVGRHPVEAVRVMQRILAQAEPLIAPRIDTGGRGVADRVTRAACEMAEEIGAAAIVVPTLSGFTARLVARHRPRVPVIALVADERVRRRLALLWGVTVVAVPRYADAKTMLERFAEPVRSTGLVPAGSSVLVTAGWPFAKPGTANLLHVATL
jgi:pyruvate kinase